MSYENPHNDTHIITYFLLDTIQYYEPTIPKELNRKPRNEPLAIKILYIHHKTTPIHTINLTPQMSQIAINPQITIPYINTPAASSINTKVHKHHTWQKTPNLPTNTCAIIPTPPLPTYTNNKHKKFIPHLYYYTDGSFQPLVQVTHNNIT
jgi:hypothetical protein